MHYLIYFLYDLLTGQKRPGRQRARDGGEMDRVQTEGRFQFWSEFFFIDGCFILREQE